MNSVFQSRDAAVFRECIEILTANHEQLKMMCEELSNVTGRAILAKLFEGISSVSAIAHALNISIPLVTRHIQRFSRVGLIELKNVDLSSKHKTVRHYKPTEFALKVVFTLSLKNSFIREFLSEATFPYSFK